MVLRRARKTLRDWLFSSKPSILSKAMGELLGCAMFSFIGALQPTPIGNGIALMASVYYVAKVSGAHLNPVVTGAFCMMGFTNPAEVCIYVASQVAGCVIGSMLLALPGSGCVIGGAPAPGVRSGCFVPPRSNMTEGAVVAWEAVGTLMFVAPVMSVVWYTQNKHGYGNVGPIMVGIALIASAMAVGDFTGAALNPARVLGPAIVYNCARNTLTASYIAGQLLGMLLSPLFIIPWYGICDDAWYIKLVPERTKEMLTRLTPSIEFKTMDTLRHRAPTQQPQLDNYSATQQQPASSASVIVVE